MTPFWITFSVLMTSLVRGLIVTYTAFDRIGGGTGDTKDLDRIVRESW